MSWVVRLKNLRKFSPGLFPAIGKLYNTIQKISTFHLIISTEKLLLAVIL